MKNKKILFVDDEATILKSFCISLKHLGHIPSGASSGEQAIAMLQRHCYDVVITDLRMPGIDGIQVLKEAKQRYPKIVVIVLTGYGDITTAIDALRLGADDYLHKPCDTNELVYRMENYIDQRETEKKLLLEQEKAARFEMTTTLAGGLSHDFNNLLTGIMGSIELAKLAQDQGLPTSTYLSMAMASCIQAQELTFKFNQLSDMFTPTSTIVAVDELVSSVCEKVHLDSGRTIEHLIPNDLWNLEVDLEKVKMAMQAILDNAREALSSGGKIVISADNYDNSRPQLPSPHNQPIGRFVRIHITDSGVGIPAQNIGKVFDPYFSTKGKGSTKGMGLGLTLANAFIEQNRGHLSITSTQGSGTTVTLFLPTSATDQVRESSPH